MRGSWRTAAGALAGAVALALGAVWWIARPPDPGAFYAAPPTASTMPGTLLRQEPFTRRVPPGARAWRILYATTRADGVPAVASALVMAAGGAAPSARPIVAWSHGTTGVAPGCAPSVLDDPFAHVPALDALLAQGWIYVATDYVGLGTSGPHPYLIGEGQARSVLDAVRAARRLEALPTDGRVVVWGHSQGGHAALWTGIVAPRYAPDVPLAGVAAVAPASDLPALIERAQDGVVGRIMSAYIVHAYAAAYDDVHWDDAVPAWKRPLVRDIASRCLAGRASLLSVAQSMLLGGRVFATSGRDGALGARLAANVPAAALSAPLMLAQGTADDLVDPQVQAAYVARRCAAGQPVDYRTYAGRDHLSVVAPDSPYAADLVAWTRERFEARPGPTTCRHVER